VSHDGLWLSDGLSGEVGLASHGARSPAKHLNFHRGLNIKHRGKFHQGDLV
jgi:hypothetical protein